MKNKIFITALVLFTMFASTSIAQYNPYSDGKSWISVGVGATGWGIPVFLRYEQAVADNVSVGGTLSYQSKSESITSNTFSYKWKHSIVGANVRGSYHFNELLNAPDEWDFYGGASLGYFFWNTKYEGTGIGLDYSGTQNGGFSIGAHVGARYFVKENLGINLELGGGNVLGGGTIGVTFLF